MGAAGEALPEPHSRETARGLNHLDKDRLRRGGTDAREGVGSIGKLVKAKGGPPRMQNRLPSCRRLRGLPLILKALFFKELKALPRHSLIHSYPHPPR